MDSHGGATIIPAVDKRIIIKVDAAAIILIIVIIITIVIIIIRKIQLCSSIVARIPMA